MIRGRKTEKQVSNHTSNKEKKKVIFTGFMEDNIIFTKRKNMLSGREGWTAINMFKRDLYLGIESNCKVKTDESVI